MRTTTDILEIPEVRTLVHRLPVEQYHRWAEHGIFSERTELIRGVVIDTLSKSPLHCYLVQQLVAWLTAHLGSGWLIREAKPLSTHDSEPEPDVCVVAGKAADFLTSHPTTASLVCEVAVSSEKLDLEKAAIYAEAGVTEYWIVLAEQRKVHVFSSPTRDGYASCSIVGENEILRSRSLAGIELPMSDLFPPQGS